MDHLFRIATVMVFLVSGSPMMRGAELNKKEPVRPVVVSTWQHGIAANEAAWRVLSAGGRALDAVEAGVRAVAILD